MKGRVVVAGALANKPGNGGAAWTRLSWALGFRRLGYDVLFVEQIAGDSCEDRSGSRCTVENSFNLEYFRFVTSRFGLRAALVVGAERRALDFAWDDLRDAAADADLLINISGHLVDAELKRLFRTRVFIDLDPGYTQFWHAQGLAEERLRDHDVYFSVGENLGRPTCSIPPGAVTWCPIRQPILLDEWPVTASCWPTPRFTTVASWRGPLGRITHGKTTFGAKAHEFRKFAPLPAGAGGAFEIALDADPADRLDVDTLTGHGWKVVDPGTVVPDPIAFRRYVQGSDAEFSVAQGIYVETQSGWFSDRTVRYLASGKPALVQDTGWSQNYPAGLGLIGFRTLAEATSGAERIARDYPAHARAARAIAEAFFDSNKVLCGLLGEIDAVVNRRSRATRPCVLS